MPAFPHALCWELIPQTRRDPCVGVRANVREVRQLDPRRRPREAPLQPMDCREQAEAVVDGTFVGQHVRRDPRGNPVSPPQNVARGQLQVFPPIPGPGRVDLPRVVRVLQWGSFIPPLVSDLVTLNPKPDTLKFFKQREASRSGSNDPEP